MKGFIIPFLMFILYVFLLVDISEFTLVFSRSKFSLILAQGI